jgi:hypothetical protein
MPTTKTESDFHSTVRKLLAVAALFGPREREVLLVDAIQKLNVPLTAIREDNFDDCD